MTSMESLSPLLALPVWTELWNVWHLFAQFYFMATVLLSELLHVVLPNTKHFDVVYGTQTIYLCMMALECLSGDPVL